MGEGLLKFITTQAYECVAGIFIGIYVTPNTYADIGFQIPACSLSHCLSYLNAFLAISLHNGGIHTASYQSSLEISIAFQATGNGAAQEPLGARFHGS